MLRDLTNYLVADAVDLSKVDSVLVIKLRNIGDVVLATPVFSVLRKNFGKNAVVDAVVYEESKVILEGNPYVDTVYGVKRREGLINSIGLAKEIRRKRYGMVINLTEGDRGGVLSLLSGAGYRVGIQHASNEKLWKQKAYTHFYQTDRVNRHAVEQDLDAIRRIGIRVKSDYEKLSIFVREEEIETAKNKLNNRVSSDKGFVILHPVSRWFFKCMSPEQIAAMVDHIVELGYSIVLTSGMDERELSVANSIERHHPEVINLAGSLSLRELIAVVNNAQMVIAPDTAIVHMAAALQVPVFVWYGPTNEYVWSPWLARYYSIKMDAKCSPCGLPGCGGGRISECLWGIDVENIKAELDQFIETI